MQLFSALTLLATLSLTIPAHRVFPSAMEKQDRSDAAIAEKGDDEPKPQVEKAEWSQSQDSTPKKPPYCALSPHRRRFILGVVTVAGFFGPFAGNIYLPALPVLQRVFGVGETAMNAIVTYFMIVFAFALFDYKGRRPLYIISLAIYIASNILMAALPSNFGALVFLRVVQAFGSAAVVSMGAGTVADTTEPRHRGKAMSHFLLGPQLGPVIGPVLGGALAEASWRRIFGFLALTGFTLRLMIVFMLPETLRCRVGNSQINTNSWFVWPPRLATAPVPPGEQGPKPPKPTLKLYWKLFSYPPIGIASFDTAILYSTYFSIAVNLPRTFRGTYGWSEGAIGASYLAVGIASIIGSLVGGRVNDWRRKVLHGKSTDTEVAPETRLFDQICGVFLCAGGTLMYGWFVDRRLHPAAVLIATFITGFGMNWVFVSSTAFLTECAPQQAAGAFALGNMLRNPAAAIAAVLTPTLIAKMSIGWVFTGFALLDLVVVGSAVLLLRWRSPYWRAKKKAAAAKS
ncbi:hypothetical protein DOTSEDRAFT_22021 [Dothistroma septosporum NZE10]|uniref:Major facilitator superfamily (MFS) profile domain-containing protein n=1 Tax=Dothistroma septosporum (strain NZE10 / CBS 128990) TaxID=675120 RepID=N1PR81_DOTSN|nr:hypothetical protein DOTSEDRAFT_22021 [Dothistroma septosporum NZE10]